MRKQGSAALSGLLRCNGLVARAAGALELKAGARVGVHEFGDNAQYVELSDFEQSCWQRWLT